MVLSLCLQMSVDEATMHAAILALNEVLDKDSVSETFAALSNPNTCIKQLEEANAPRYHEILVEAKKTKAEAASEVRWWWAGQREDILSCYTFLMNFFVAMLVFCFQCWIILC